MIAALREAEESALELGLPFRPKAIYVSNTNSVQGQVLDSHTVPFENRSARPILIWRHLVEHHGIDPKKLQFTVT